MESQTIAAVPNDDLVTQKARDEFEEHNHFLSTLENAVAAR